MGRPPCCDKSNVKRGLWTAEEDAKLLAHVSKHGIGNWTLVPKKAGLNRCGKSCRLRWTNYLRPDLKHDHFTPQEEDLITNLHQAIGSRWSLIAKQLPGRTDNDVKNYWNTKLRKKLFKIGIDPITHKPFSQVFSEFGNINGLPNTARRHIFPKSEPSSVISTGLIPSTNMITGPTIEQGQDYNSFSNKNNDHPSLDFLAQIQVINQDINNVNPHFFNEVTSSCSSSSSSHVTDLSSPKSQTQIIFTPSSSSSSLNWSEFLLRETFQPNTEETEEKQEEQEDLQGLLSSTNPTSFSQSEITELKFTDCDFGPTINVSEGDQRNYQPEISSVNSFVDTILDRDSELRAAFPEFMDGSFEYY